MLVDLAIELGVVVSSYWDLTTVDTGYSYTSLDFTPAGRPAISYHDDTNDKLKYSTRGLGWQ